MKFRFVISLLFFSLCVYADNKLSEEVYNLSIELVDACAEGDLKEVESLLSRGAVVNSSEFCVLHIACIAGNLEVIKCLLRHGADINSKIEYDMHFGKTPLHMACAHGHLEIVKYLIKRGADSDLQDGEGATPLSIAWDAGKLNVVRYFLLKKAQKLMHSMKMAIGL